MISSKVELRTYLLARLFWISTRRQTLLLRKLSASD